MAGEEVGEDDCYLSFLPLAHVFDRVTEEFMLSRGGAVGYWQGVQEKVAEDIAALQPTLFCGVPRVYDRIHAGVLQQASRTPVRRAVFDWAVARKAYFMRDEGGGHRHDAASPFLDWLVFRKVKARLGGRLRLVISGAAPLARGVEEFMQVRTFCVLGLLWRCLDRESCGRERMSHGRAVQEASALLRSGRRRLFVRRALCPRRSSPLCASLSPSP